MIHNYIRCFLACFIVLLASGCGPNAEDRKRVDALNKLNEQRAAKEALFSLALFEAQDAIEKKDAAGLTKAAGEMAKLGDDAIQRLSDQASDASQPVESRIEALTILGEMGPAASSAAATVEAIDKNEKDAEVKKAATAALSRIRAAR